MTDSKILSTISTLGFAKSPNNENIYTISVGNIEYELSVDFERQKIDYGPEIKRGDDSTSHLQAPENLVVLECVTRLIQKGYKPEDLTLEKKWKLGRSTKGGKADITVHGKDGKTLLIIECKTWGTEYEKEMDRMKSSGGQLFSYYQQDKNTRYLCLYTSRESSGNIESKNALLKVEDTTQEKIRQQDTDKLITYDKASTVKELVDVWKFKTDDKQTFLHTGIFEDDIEPYNPGYIPLKVSDLKEFKKDDRGKVFNEFEEILRHNNISDRSNAFNRIISLILAKIVDENKADDSITDFQVKEGIDDAESLLERLQSLYSKAMRDYLDEEVIDYKLEDVEREIANFPRQTAKETLYRIYKELKFYQNNEFAFKEVYNKELFEENAKVLEEVVRLFQEYRFKYDQKAQFLGDFFELMLESGYKQTEGQFFTPTPITRFIISSIPLSKVIEEKIEKQEKSFLPKVVDFACGSGHFLTEAIEKISKLIEELNEDDLEDEQHLGELKRYKESMRWANEYIFGIEKDYRLARTSQVACFMHGDGDANVIFGDGLEKHDRLDKDGTYDVLIANPPYTIKDFKKHLKVNPRDFELWEHVTSDSDDIEVFFIERMKQLLRSGGMAGIILPSSILSNSGTYTKAREILLKYFEVKAIVEFGSSTFSATGTNTVTLFLKKRDDNFVKNCRYIAEDFILENKEREGDFINSDKLLESYVEYLNLELNDYKSLLAKNPNKKLKESLLYQNYQSWFDDLTEVKNYKKKDSFKKLNESDKEKRLTSLFFDLVLELESEKFFYFLLTHRMEGNSENSVSIEDETGGKKPIKIKHPHNKAVPQTTIICKSGNTLSEQRDFLGYKFSNRRGYKGIDYTGETKMYDMEDKFNSEKINSYIYKNFLDIRSNISEAVSEHLSKARLFDLINFEKNDFDKKINLEARKTYVDLDFKYKLKPFDHFATLEYGNSLPEDERIDGDYPVVGSNGVIGNHNEFLIEGPAIIVGRKGSAGKINWINENCYPIDTTFYCSTKDNVKKKFFYNLIRLIDLESFSLGTGVPGLNRNDVHRIKLPEVPLEVQEKIIDEIDKVEQNKNKAQKKIEKKNSEIEDVVEDWFKKFSNKKLDEIVELRNGQGLTQKDIVKGDFPVYGGNGITGHHNDYIIEDSTVAIGRVGANCGAIHITKPKSWVTDNSMYVKDWKLPCNKKYIAYSLKKLNLNRFASKASHPNISQTTVLSKSIPWTDEKTQDKEISKIEVLENQIQKQKSIIEETDDKKREIISRFLEE